MILKDKSAFVVRKTALMGCRQVSPTDLLLLLDFSPAPSHTLTYALAADLLADKSEIERVVSLWDISLRLPPNPPPHPASASATPGRSPASSPASASASEASPAAPPRK